METLSCDLETYSSEDLRKCGVYRYCEAPDFEILLFAYSVDGGEVQLADLASGEKLPRALMISLGSFSRLRRKTSQGNHQGRDR